MSNVASIDVAGMLYCGAQESARVDLILKARRGATALQALGLRSGDRIAILMHNDLAYLEVSFAAAFAGVQAVPVNWRLANEEIAFVLADSEARAIIGHADALERLGDAAPAGIPLFAVDPKGDADGEQCYRSWDDFVTGQTPIPGEAPPARESLFYTSGTSGRPKGVLRRAPDAAQAAARSRNHAQCYDVRPDARILVPGPLYHGAPNNLALGAARVADRTVIMPRFDSEEALRLIERHRITSVFFVPTMFVRLLRLPAEIRARYDLSSLRHVIHAAAPCAPEIKRRMIDWLGPIVYEFYGATETGAVTWCDTAQWLAHPGTVGRPMEGGHVRIVREDGSEAAAGEQGRIFVKLDCMPPFAYLNAAPGQDGEAQADGFIAASDIGYLDEDGFLFICDRARDMVISGGANIYPAEIEAALLSLPGVRDAAVIGVPDAEFGESLLAFVDADPGLTEAGIKADLRGHIAGYKIPRRVEFRGDLPRDENGKLLKRLLRENYWTAAGRRI